MPGYKRRATGSPARMRRAKRGRARASTVALRPTLAKQVRSLIRGSANQTVTQSLAIADFYAVSGHFLTCLYGDNAPAQAGVCNSGDGRLVAPGREKALIKGVHQRGTISIYAPNSIVSAPQMAVRRLTVWFFKPATQPSTTGALPPLSDVLEDNSATGAFHSLPLAKSAVSGSFMILDDKKWFLGSALVDNTATQSYAASFGHCRIDFDDYIKIGKDVTFVGDATEAVPGGHYDSDTTAGRVGKGLLVQYWILDGGGGTTAAAVLAGNSRVDYMC